MANEQTPTEKQLVLHQLYIKDFSFESPKSPNVFQSVFAARDLINIQSVNRQIDDETTEVTLSLTVKAVSGDDTIFLIELVQAGLFTIKGFTSAERHALLGSVCPDMLYPYAREAVADFSIRGGFPPLLLQAIDFNTLYAQNMQARTAGPAQPDAGTTPAPGAG